MTKMTPIARVLIVEDSFPVADSLRIYLEAEGYAVRIVGSLGRALAAVTEDSFDIAVLDIMLANETIAPLAAKLQADGIPFIYLSGFADAQLLPPELRRHRRLDKPCDPTVLVTAMREILAPNDRTP